MFIFLIILATSMLIIGGLFIFGIRNCKGYKKVIFSTIYIIFIGTTIYFAFSLMSFSLPQVNKVEYAIVKSKELKTSLKISKVEAQNLLSKLGRRIYRDPASIFFPLSKALCNSGGVLCEFYDENGIMVLQLDLEDIGQCGTIRINHKQYGIVSEFYNYLKEIVKSHNFTIGLKEFTYTNIIVVDNILLGGTFEGHWTNAYSIGKKINGREYYELYSLSEFLGGGTGSSLKIKTLPSKIESIEIKPQDGIDEKDYIALSTCGNPMPRIPKILSTELPDYKEAARDTLEKYKLTEIPVDIKQCFSVDLDGDGIEEVLFNATNYDNPTINNMEDTYSFIGFQKSIQGEETTILINGFFSNWNKQESGKIYDDIASVYRILGILDVNEDGKMEIIISDRYYEGMRYLVYEVNYDEVREVLRNGWGKKQ